MSHTLHILLFVALWTRIEFPIDMIRVGTPRAFPIKIVAPARSEPPYAQG